MSMEAARVCMGQLNQTTFRECFDREDASVKIILYNSFKKFPFEDIQQIDVILFAWN